MIDFKSVGVSVVLALALAAYGGLSNAQGKFTGGMMTDSAGMTVYTYDKDSGGKSACSGACVSNWPPLKAAADAKATGDWSIVTRDDGSKQWAYKGKPLYLYAKDQKAGDKVGDGVGGVWHMVKQ